MKSSCVMIGAALFGFAMPACMAESPPETTDQQSFEVPPGVEVREVPPELTLARPAAVTCTFTSIFRKQYEAG